MRNRFNDTLNELEGYLELGMTKETLTVARAILKQHPVIASSFCQAVTALLIKADKLKPWQLLIENTYDSLNRKEKKQAAIEMLHFYVSIKDWKKAANFVPKRTNDPMDLLFSMWTWLELKEIEKAKIICKKCLRLLRKVDPDDDFVASSLLEAVASYHAQTGDWHQAERVWKYGRKYPWFAENAWEGLVRLHAYRGFLEANNAFESVKGKDFLEDKNLALMLPDNSSERSAQVDKIFHRYAKHLAKVIPAKERWRFGL